MRLGLVEMRPFMSLDHKLVKVDPALRGNVAWQSIKKEVHEHALSCANVSIQIQSFGNILRDGRDLLRVGLVPERKPGEQPFRRLQVLFWIRHLGLLVVFQTVVQTLERFHNGSLVSVISQDAGRDQLLIAFRRGGSLGFPALGGRAG